MPVMKCGDNGYKWGDSGKCFTGPGSREKAAAQGRAIAASQRTYEGEPKKPGKEKSFDPTQLLLVDEEAKAVHSTPMSRDEEKRRKRKERHNALKVVEQRGG